MTTINNTPAAENKMPSNYKPLAEYDKGHHTVREVELDYTEQFGMTQERVEELMAANFMQASQGVDRMMQKLHKRYQTGEGVRKHINTKYALSCEHKTMKELNLFREGWLTLGVLVTDPKLQAFYDETAEAYALITKGDRFGFKHFSAPARYVYTEENHMRGDVK